MTDYEDDSDGELPSISLSQSTGIKTEFEMPPAAELVAQREREAAAARALHELRAAEDAAEAARRSHRDCQTLSSGVTALEMTGSVCEDTQRQVEELTVMAAHLPAQDAAFLTTYAKALQDAPSKAAATAITNQVVSGVCLGLTRGAWEAGAPGALGAAAALLAAPPGPRPRRALHALLDRGLEDAQIAALAAASAAARGPASVAARGLAAHDAARSGARRGADRLASRLLAAAVDHIVEGSEPTAGGGPLCAARWRRLPATDQLLLLRAAARALAAEAGAGGGGGGGEGEGLLAALAQPLPRAPRRDQLQAGDGADVPLRHRVMASVTKLQLLFGRGRRAQADESKEQVGINTEPELNADERPQLDEDMAAKNELEKKLVPELDNNNILSTKTEVDNERLAEMASEGGVQVEQAPTEPTDETGRGPERGSERTRVRRGEGGPARRSPRLAARPPPAPRPAHART